MTDELTGGMLATWQFLLVSLGPHSAMGLLRMVSSEAAFIGDSPTQSRWPSSRLRPTESKWPLSPASARGCEVSLLHLRGVQGMFASTRL